MAGVTLKFRLCCNIEIMNFNTEIMKKSAHLNFAIGAILHRYATEFYPQFVGDA